ncbi:MAG: nuclear transport factor 2 family protein [Terriglobales bacterium]
MHNCRLLLLLSVMFGLLAGGSAISAGEIVQPQASGQASNQVSTSERTIWNLEHEYWHYVQDNNLAAYLGLWHKNFLGWPSFSASPVGKDHITDWITSQTAKGLTFKSIAFKPAKVQATGDIAVASYWITFKWLDKDGKGAAHTLRIIHTWVKDGNDWRIIGGMSMPEPAQN